MDARNVVQTSYQQSIDVLESQVEKSFILKSGYQDIYTPDEKIRTIIVENFPELGRLTALRFLEWVQHNPNGVISLPTGKTPEYFIQWVTRYLSGWMDADVQDELVAVGIDPQEKPDMKGLHFVQMDEFYPIDSNQHNSFCNYVRKYYIEGFGLDQNKALLIDCNEVGLKNGESIKDVWLNGVVDLNLWNREPTSKQEERQKLMLLDVNRWCLTYEEKIKQLGGIGFFLGGIGPDGHVAFNIRGSSHHSITRLLETNYETQAAAAGDLGGIEVSGRLPVITIGLKTITRNSDCTAIIMAAGEAKSPMVSNAVCHNADTLYPATALHALKNSVFYVTCGSAKLLSQRNMAAVKQLKNVPANDLEKAIIDLSLAKGKTIQNLDTQDFEHDPIFSYIIHQIPEYNFDLLKKKTIRSLTQKIENGIADHSGLSFLHTEPHHDDIMLGYQPALTKDLHDSGSSHAFATLTSGFTAVTNHCLRERVGQVQEFIFRKKFKPLKTKDEEIFQYLSGLALKKNRMVKSAEAARFLRCLMEIFETEEMDVLEKKTQWIIHYLNQRYPGQKDEKEIQLLKGMMREWEAETLWGAFGVLSRDVHHLRLGFYKGDIFTEEPTASRDIPPIIDLLRQVKPNILTVALDPEASGPDTHYKVLQAIAEAIRQMQDNQEYIPNKVWGYRNVWYRFHPSEADLFFPVSLDELASMHSLFLDMFVTQKTASFPSYEHKGPFSELAQQIQSDQYQKIRTCLGDDWFRKHPNPRIRSSCAMIYLKEMNIEAFLSQAREIKKHVENR